MKSNSTLKMILIALAAWVVLSLVVMNSAKNTIDGNLGRVWNQISTGAEKINTLQQQVQTADSVAQSYIDQMTAARNDILAAQQTGDLDGALNALGQANTAMVSLNALAESNPEIIQLTPLYTSLLDETAGVFNRVGYARDQLIDSQVAYNNGKILWLPGYIILGPEETTGADFNPQSNVNIQPMGGS